MGTIFHSLIWAGAILAAAVICSTNGMGDNASVGIVMGLSGAAWAALHSKRGCNRECV